MDGDNVRKEHSPRAKKRIREEDAGEEEAEKKRVQRHSRAKRRPGDGMSPLFKQDGGFLHTSLMIARLHVGGDQEITRASGARRGLSEGWSRLMTNSRACRSPQQVRHRSN